MVHVWSVCHKAPSAKRCIKTQYDRQPSRTCCLRQKAPSAKRCIKTTVPSAGRQWPIRVRKHRAPKGALRPRANATDKDFATLCQKAPSAKRCIKTPRSCRTRQSCTSSVRKHRAPKGALRPMRSEDNVARPLMSQKAPSAKRSIMTIGRILNSATCSAVSESTERQKVH